MKYIKLFENFNKSDLEKELDKYGIKNYTINDDGTIDVDGSVHLSLKNLTEIPFKFGKVTGSFDCSYNKLKYLNGSPYYVGRRFNCDVNKLVSLEGSPDEVIGDFDCRYNNLTSLEGSPKEVIGNFDCRYNNLTYLKGMTLEIGGNFDCRYQWGKDNNLTSLSSISNVEGDIYCDKEVDISTFDGYCKKIIQV